MNTHPLRILVEADLKKLLAYLRGRVNAICHIDEALLEKALKLIGELHKSGRLSVTVIAPGVERRVIGIASGVLVGAGVGVAVAGLPGAVVGAGIGLACGYAASHIHITLRPDGGAACALSHS